MARPESALLALERVIVDRLGADPADSYVAGLCQGDEDQLLKKIAEEAAEVMLAAKSDSDREIVEESADLLFHLMVVLSRHGISIERVTECLESRAGVSGLRQKSLRRPNKSS